MRYRELPRVDEQLVVLRPILALDLAVWRDYLTRPIVYEHTSWDIRSTADLQQYVWQPGLPEFSAMRLAVALRTTNRLVGTIGFHTVQPANRGAELAYDLSPDFWGQGLMSRLVTAVTRWAHEDPRLLRIQATVLSSNVRSRRVLEKAGFSHEGLLRSYRIVRGTPRDFDMFAHVQNAESISQ